MQRELGETERRAAHVAMYVGTRAVPQEFCRAVQRRGALRVALLGELTGRRQWQMNTLLLPGGC